MHSGPRYLSTFGLYARLSFRSAPLVRTALSTQAGYTAFMSDEPRLPDGFDLNGTLRAISEADVLVVGFGWLAERLLADLRSNQTAGPFIRVVQPVRTPNDRLRQLKALRPSFDTPESFVFFPWAGRVDAFVQAQLFDRILDRCRGDETAQREAQQALKELLALDQQDLRQAILGGEKYHALYEAHQS